MTEYKIQPQDNPYFSITRNDDFDCFDLVFKQAKYDTSDQLLGIVSFIHQMGVNCPNDKLRIGAVVEEAKSSIINTSGKIIANDSKLIM